MEWGAELVGIGTRTVAFGNRSADLPAMALPHPRCVRRHLQESGKNSPSVIRRWLSMRGGAETEEIRRAQAAKALTHPRSVR